MNKEYTLLKDGCIAMLNKDNVPQEVKEQMQKDIAMYEALEQLDNDTIIRIFDTGVYNDIVKDFCCKAMANCGIEQGKIAEVMHELKYLFDTVQATEITV